MDGRVGTRRLQIRYNRKGRLLCANMEVYSVESSRCDNFTPLYNLLYSVVPFTSAKYSITQYNIVHFGAVKFSSSSVK